MSESKFFNPSTREAELKFSFHAEMKRFCAKLYETVSVFFFFFFLLRRPLCMDRRFSCRRSLYCLFIYPVALLDASTYLLSFAFFFFFLMKTDLEIGDFSSIILYSNIYRFDEEIKQDVHRGQKGCEER